MRRRCCWYAYGGGWYGWQGFFFFFFQAEDGIRDRTVTGVQTLLFRSLRLRRRRRAIRPIPCRRLSRTSRPHEVRSEERRVGKECRSRWSAHREKKKREITRMTKAH